MKVIISPLPRNMRLSKEDILDGVLIANACIDDRTLFGKSGIICKLDLEKSYDYVN